MSSIAEENNNPGNLRPPKGVTYEGQIGVDDKGFAIFENKKYGKQALINDVQHKLENGLNTPSAFIDRYAPGGDNSQESRDNYKIYLADKLGLNSTGDPFPEKSHEQIADAIAEFESGVKPPKPSYTVPSVPTQGAPLAKSSNNQTSAPQPFQISEPIAAVAGGLGGASLGSTAAVYKAKLDAAHDAYDALHKRTFGESPSVGQTNVQTIPEETSLLPTEEQHARAIQGNKKETGITGRASQTTYNLRTQQIAEQSRKQKQIMEELRKLGILTGEMKPLSEMGGLASTPSGVVGPINAVEDLAQTQAPKELPLSSSSPEELPLSSSSKFGAYVKNLVGLPIKGALAGAGVGLGAADVYNRIAQKDYEGAKVAGVGTISPLLAPFIASGGILPAIGMATPLYLGASDRLKYLEKHPEEYQLDANEYDAMGNRQR